MPSIKELKLTAALYATQSNVLAHVRYTGILPRRFHMGGGDIGLRLLIETRGIDIDLTPDEELVYEAISRERWCPGGSAVLLEPDFAPAPSSRGND
jgi:hypothetical protein